MGCAPNSPTHDEKTFVFSDAKSPFMIREAFEMTEKSAGGTKSRVKKYRKRAVPRLKSINESNLMLKRGNSMKSFASLDFSPSSYINSESPMSGTVKYNEKTMIESFGKIH